MKNKIKFFSLCLLSLCIDTYAQVPGTPYILPGSTCIRTVGISGNRKVPCCMVSGATKNDSTNTYGIEYDWTGGTGNLPNNVTYQALVEIDGQCWYRYNSKRPSGTYYPGAQGTDVGAYTIPPSGTYYVGYLYQRSIVSGACPSGFRVATKEDWINLTYTLGSWCSFQSSGGPSSYNRRDSLFARMTASWMQPGVIKSGLNLYGGSHYCNSCSWWNYSNVLYAYQESGTWSNIYWQGPVQNSFRGIASWGNYDPTCNGSGNDSYVGYNQAAVMSYQPSSPEPEEYVTVRCVAN